MTQKLSRLAVLKEYRKYSFGRELVLALHDWVKQDATSRGLTTVKIVCHSQIPVKVSSSLLFSKGLWCAATTGGVLTQKPQFHTSKDSYSLLSICRSVCRASTLSRALLLHPPSSCSPRSHSTANTCVIPCTFSSSTFLFCPPDLVIHRRCVWFGPVRTTEPRKPPFHLASDLPLTIFLSRCGHSIASGSSQFLGADLAYRRPIFLSVPIRFSLIGLPIWLDSLRRCQVLRIPFVVNSSLSFIYLHYVPMLTISPSPF